MSQTFFLKRTILSVEKKLLNYNRWIRDMSKITTFDNLWLNNFWVLFCMTVLFLFLIWQKINYLPLERRFITDSFGYRRYVWFMVAFSTHRLKDSFRRWCYKNYTWMIDRFVGLYRPISLRIKTSSTFDSGVLNIQY